MQGAVLAGALAGMNKVGKHPAEAARRWPLPLGLNPSFEAVRGLQAGPPLERWIRRRRSLATSEAGFGEGTRRSGLGG